MTQFCFDESRFAFPPVSESDEEGLLLIGGKPTAARVLQAYRLGIFPWYSGDELPMWWSPDPRFVLFTSQLHISRSMQKVMRSGVYEYRENTAFSEVLSACAQTPRNGEENGTWITKEITTAYTALFWAGYGFSAETWEKETLVGGVYGLLIGNVCFGESMFHTRTNASKFAFIKLVQSLQAKGIELMDCQVHTPHVQSLGGRLIPRATYLQLLAQNKVERTKE